MRNKQIENKETYFLATTALDEFWDTTKPILFLGQWCLLYSRRSFWGSLDSYLLESPLNNSYTRHASHKIVSDIYEFILPLLGHALNSIHGKSYNDRYWRILIGPWLQFYLSATFDRFIHIKHALELHQNCTTFGLSEHTFSIPNDTIDFVNYIKDDLYNLQLYTKIFMGLGLTFPCKRPHVAGRKTYGKFINNSLKSKSVSCIKNLYMGVCKKYFQSIFIKSSYFSKKTLLRLMLRTSGKIFPILGVATKHSSFQYDSNMRRSLQQICIGNGEFERCLSTMLYSDIPICFVEGFESINKEVKKYYPKNKKAIFSSNAWYYDESFKQWAAGSSDRGTLLLGAQHGGNYGSKYSEPSEDHEITIVDYYYSWGWDKGFGAERVIPMPATKMVGRSEIGASNKKRGVLWAGTFSPRYLALLAYLPADFQEYLSWQCRFARSLLREIISEVRFRPHQEDNGWGIIQRLKDCVPGVTIETWEIPFYRSLSNCRLFVCDNLSTTFAEALAADKPTILFWSPQVNTLRRDAQPYYDLLRRSGILFDTPESAGAAVNSVYGNVETWWNEPERQNAVKLFCERFARTSLNAVELWTAELGRIAGLPSAVGD